MGDDKRFGRYDLLEPIAKGGMAEVFKARARDDVGFERVVAVKRILPHLAADQEFVSMFIDEAKIAVQLQHQSIAQIYDLGRVDEHYYIALEYIHGRDLRALTNAESGRGGVVPIEAACFIVMKVAQALDYAHRAEGRDGRPLHVIHRDVSPQNVIVSFEGDVKVIDFGLAKATGRSTQTQAGMLKGKLAYLSPEQAHGEIIDWRSDIYAVGILLFELLTGQRLFLRDNDIDTVMAVRSGEIPDPRGIASDISDELAGIVFRALSRDRRDRYQRGQELAEDLEAVLYSTGNPLSRRKLGDYMVELFPEEFIGEEAVEAMLEMELIDDDEVLDVSDEPGLAADPPSVHLEPPVAQVAHAAHVADIAPSPGSGSMRSGDVTDLQPDEDSLHPFFDGADDEEEDRTQLFMPDDDFDDTTSQVEDIVGTSAARNPLPSPVEEEPEEPKDTKRSTLPPAPEHFVASPLFDVETGTTLEVHPVSRRGKDSGVLPAAPDRVTVEARMDDDADLVTSASITALGFEELLSAEAARRGHGERDGGQDLQDVEGAEDDGEGGSDREGPAVEAATVIASVEPSRDTIPAPAPEDPAPPPSLDEMASSAVQSLERFPLFSDMDDEPEEGTVVTAFTDELTKPIDSDSEAPDPARGGSRGQSGR